jgi:hypothetical protein
MKSKTKHRLAVACLGAILSALAAFIGAGLTGWAFHIYHFGMRAPEMFGWFGVFFLFGLIALSAVAPALLTIVACGIAWCTPLGRHALISVTVPLLLGCLAIAVCMLTNPHDIALSGFIVAGASCLGITGVIEVLMRKKLQNQPVEATADPPSS